MYACGHVALQSKPVGDIETFVSITPEGDGETKVSPISQNEFC